MDNQHRKIKGYRELTQAEIDLMNKIKEKAAEVGDLVAELEDWAGGSPAEPGWVQLGRDDLQKGFMSLTRSVAKPDFF
jgi:hypothetical protein